MHYRNVILVSDDYQDSSSPDSYGITLTDKVKGILTLIYPPKVIIAFPREMESLLSKLPRVGKDDLDSSVNIIQIGNMSPEIQARVEEIFKEKGLKDKEIHCLQFGYFINFIRYSIGGAKETMSHELIVSLERACVDIDCDAYPDNLAIKFLQTIYPKKQ